MQACKRALARRRTTLAGPSLAALLSSMGHQWNPEINNFKNSSKSPETKKEEKKRRKKGSYLDGIIGSNVVLIDGLQPPNVVVSVGHQMDVDLSRHDPVRRVVAHVRRIRTCEQCREAIQQKKKKWCIRHSSVLVSDEEEVESRKPVGESFKRWERERERERVLREKRRERGQDRHLAVG